MADFTGKIHTSALHLSHDGRLLCISTAALITNIPLTSWGNEMIFTKKKEKKINLTEIIKIYSIN
jgi:6-phosphogluconolactonase (cycloisomerase 2 family)